LYKPAAEINQTLAYITFCAVLNHIAICTLQLYLSISDFTNHLFGFHQLETIIVSQLLPLSNTLVTTQWNRTYYTNALANTQKCPCLFKLLVFS